MIACEPGGATVTAKSSVPYLRRVSILHDRVESFDAFPFSLPFVRNLDYEFKTPITFLVGENGSGKSTFIEAVVELCGLPVAGGGRNELPEAHGPHLRSELAPALRASFARKPPDGYFLRAEFQAHFASLLEQRRQDPDFLGDPFARYGGASLHTRSHGEAFLEMLVSWMHPGMVIMDEPEAALSPQRQLTLLARMARLAAGGKVQFVVATHSAILLTLPGATILSFDGGQLKEVGLEETSHYQITRGILESPARYWKHLMRDEEQ